METIITTATKNVQSQMPIDVKHQENLRLVKSIAEFMDNTYGERFIQKVLNALEIINRFQQVN